MCMPSYIEIFFYNSSASNAPCTTHAPVAHSDQEQRAARGPTSRPEGPAHASSVCDCQLWHADCRSRGWCTRRHQRNAWRGARDLGVAGHRWFQHVGDRQPGPVPTPTRLGRHEQQQQPVLRHARPGRELRHGRYSSGVQCACYNATANKGLAAFSDAAVHEINLYFEYSSNDLTHAS